MICCLCDRDVPKLTEHHLVPKLKTRRKNEDPSPTIRICSACHRQIHALFDHDRLAKELYTLELLKDEPDLEKFLTWIKKQDPTKKVQVHSKKKITN